MDWNQVFFVFCSGLLLLSALGVIASWDPVRGVLCLIAAFFSAALLWMGLESEFLSIILVLVYVGAVMVLFLFVIMMLHVKPGNWQTHWVRYWPFALFLGALFIAEWVWIFQLAPVPLIFEQVPASRTASFNQIRVLGEALFSDYLYPFELAGVILWVAIVAAIALTLKGPRKRRAQSVTQQLQANKQSHVRLEKGIGAP